MSKQLRFLFVGQPFVPRAQIVQDKCRQISCAGPGRSDLVARRVARLWENAPTLTCFAENFFVILVATYQPVKKFKKLPN